MELVGKLLDGRYQIDSRLSQGGFGETYIACDIRRPGQPKCVVKHLKPIFANNPSAFATAQRLFAQEAETLEKLGEHSQIPRLLAHFEEDREFYLVQEFVDGISLDKEIVTGKKHDEKYVIALLQDILPVLQFIHQQNVLHRDIKPPNIVRRYSDNKLALIDFGAVKNVQMQTAMTHGMTSSVAIGTDGYSPSEQLRGRPKPSSDLYALGMVAIQALTGVMPRDIPEDEDEELVWQNLATVSPSLSALLTTMVRHSAKERFQSAAEVLTALAQMAGGFIPTMQTQAANGNSQGYTPTVQTEAVNNRSTSQGYTPTVQATTYAEQEAERLKQQETERQRHQEFEQQQNLEAARRRQENVFTPSNVTPSKGLRPPTMALITFIAGLASFAGFIAISQSPNRGTNTPIVQNPVPNPRPENNTPIVQNPVPNPRPENSSPDATVFGEPGSKNIRSGPGTEYGVVFTTDIGDRFKIIGSGTDTGGYRWYRGFFPRRGEGWIAAQLVSVDGQNP